MKACTEVPELLRASPASATPSLSSWLPGVPSVPSLPSIGFGRAPSELVTPRDCLELVVEGKSAGPGGGWLWRAQRISSEVGRQEACLWRHLLISLTFFGGGRG